MPNARRTRRGRQTGWTCRPPTRPPRRPSTPGCSAGPTTTSRWRGTRCTPWPRSAATSVAAIAPQSPELAAAGAPPMWNTYLAVDSADEAAAKVGPAGGKVAMEPFDVMDAGRMAFVLDPAAPPVALWQAGQHIGATLVNEPGAVIWNELITDDPPPCQVLRAGARDDHLHRGHGRGRVHHVQGRRQGGRRHHRRRRWRACPTTGTCTSPSPTRTPPPPR